MIKINKTEYVADKEILPSNQQQIVGQARFTYSPLGKAFEKQMKTIEDQGERQVETSKEQHKTKSKEQTKPIEGKINN